MVTVRSSPKKAIITNLCLVLIIVFVYTMAFTSLGKSLLSRGPVLKGNTGQNNIALQITVDNSSDVDAYMDMLDDFNVKSTFFFCEQLWAQNEKMIDKVLNRGHGVGYYLCEENSKKEAVNEGRSIPVMSYSKNREVLEVCPSIDITKLKNSDDWQQTLDAKISNDMFIYLSADNNFSDFEKIIQIVLNKGYTILKIEQML